MRKPSSAVLKNTESEQMNESCHTVELNEEQGKIRNINIVSVCFVANPGV